MLLIVALSLAPRLEASTHQWSEATEATDLHGETTAFVVHQSTLREPTKIGGSAEHAIAGLDGFEVGDDEENDDGGEALWDQELRDSPVRRAAADEGDNLGMDDGTASEASSGLDSQFSRQAQRAAEAAAHSAAEAAAGAAAQAAAAEAAAAEARASKKAAEEAVAAEEAAEEAPTESLQEADAKIAVMGAEEAEADAQASAEEFTEVDEREKEFGFVEGEEGAEEELEAEIEFDSVDISISWMLLGTVSSVMGLFIIVNVRDDDLRRYAWNIISTTISIFTAVLMFSGVNVVVMTVIEGLPETMKLCVVYFMFVSLFLGLQVTIAFTSGAICEPPPPPHGDGVDLDKVVWIVADPVREDYEEEVSEAMVERSLGDKGIARKDGLEVFVKRVKHEYDQRNMRMKCWATLLSHMAGFAAINAGGVLQHQTYFAGSPASCLLAVICNQVGLFALFKIVDLLRQVREDETERDVRDSWFDEEVVEAENDISGLAVSFLLVQVLRFSISGVLPNVEGLEEPERAHSVACVCALFMSGMSLAVLSVLLVGAEGWFPPAGKHGGQSGGGIMQRVLRVGRNTCAMSFAWCLLWATRWTAARWQDELSALGISADTIGGRIVLAMFLTCVAFATISMLDRVEDLGLVGDERASSALNSMINALSILVGFSWEHCFDGAVAAVASLTPHPFVAKGVMAIFVFILVVRPWRKYILGRVLRAAALHDEKKAIAKKRQERVPHAYTRIIQPMRSTRCTGL